MKPWLWEFSKKFRGEGEATEWVGNDCSGCWIWICGLIHGAGTFFCTVSCQNHTSKTQYVSFLTIWNHPNMLATGCPNWFFLIFYNFRDGPVVVISFKTLKKIRKKRVECTVIKGLYIKSTFSLLKKLHSRVTQTLDYDFLKIRFLISGATAPQNFMIFSVF